MENLKNMKNFLFYFKLCLISVFLIQKIFTSHF